MQPVLEDMAQPDEDGGKEVEPGLLAWAALIFGNIVIAFGPLFVRYSDTGPIATGFWRLFLALPVLLLVARWRGLRAGALSKGQLLLAGAGGCFFAFDILSWHLGIMRTKMANATLFGNFASLILVIYAIILLRKMPHRWQILAVLLALVGSALLMGQSLELSPKHLAGDLLSLTAGTIYAAYLLAMMRLRRGLDSWAALALAAIPASLILLTGAAIAGEQIIPVLWWPVILLALSSQVVGQGSLTYALPHFSPLIIGLALLLQPVIAAATGWYLFGEAMSPLDWMGSIMVMLALVFARLEPPAKAAASSGA